MQNRMSIVMATKTNETSVCFVCGREAELVSAPIDRTECGDEGSMASGFDATLTFECW